MAFLVFPITGASAVTPDGPRTPRPPRTGTSTAEPSATPASGKTASAKAHHDPVAATPRAGSLRGSVITSAPDNGRRMIALTLDDGYRADPRLLDMAEQLGIHGTAFLVGAVAESSPWLVRRLLKAGWEVCSHTYSHKVLTGLSDQAIETEIKKGADAVAAAAAGWRCPYFRPPTGAVNAAVVRAASRLGLKVVNWNASISDSTSESTPPSRQVNIALGTIRPGGILLGHFGGAHSYVVLRQVLDTIFQRGYRVGTMSDLLHGTQVDEPRNLAALGPRLEIGLLDSMPEIRDSGASWVHVSEEVPPGAWAGIGLLALGIAMLAVSGVRHIRPPAVWNHGLPERFDDVVASASAVSTVRAGRSRGMPSN